MLKPNDFEEVQGFGDFKPLPPGGYVCKIMEVKETLSQSTAREMLVISIDIAEGEYKGYYADKYRAKQGENKVWEGRVFQLTKDKDGKTSKGFKTFVTAVRESNPGFEPAWSNDTKVFENSFKGKLVGGVFRREEYEKKDKSGQPTGETAWSSKCFMFRSVDAVRKGIDVPEDKPLPPKTQSIGGFGGFASGLVDPMTGETVSEDDLPF